MSEPDRELMRQWLAEYARAAIAKEWSDPDLARRQQVILDTFDAMKARAEEAEARLAAQVESNRVANLAVIDRMRKAEADRDRLAATVERVRSLALLWRQNRGNSSPQTGGWYVVGACADQLEGALSEPRVERRKADRRDERCHIAFPGGWAAPCGRRTGHDRRKGK